MIKLFFKSLLFFSILLFQPISAFGEDVLDVFVSIQPQKFLAEQVLGSRGRVHVLVGPDKSPHSYEPLPKQMAELARADVYFSVGVPFEKHFIDRVSSLCPGLKIVPSHKGIELRTMEEENENEHHSHKGTDPHIWLDPVRSVQIAENITAALQKLRPDLSEEFKNNFQSFKQKADDLIKQLSVELAPLKGSVMLVFHPAFGYFADRFGLIQRSIEYEGKEPGLRRLAGLIKFCRANNVKVVFVQKQFSAAAARNIAAGINGIVISIDPLGENLFDNLKDIAEAVKKIQ